MIAIAAVDVREGACVQLVGGDFGRERVRLPDARGAAGRWASAGFRRLHVVDLDAAAGRGGNRATIDGVIAAVTVPVQVGGGIRDGAAIAGWLERGAERVVVGTRAVADPEWLAAATAAYPGRLVVAADVRGADVVTHAWRGSAGRDIRSLLRDVAGLALAAVLVTAVHREGRLEGPDLRLMEDLAARTAQPLLASGGVSTMEDLRALAGIGIAGAIVGMALYTGALDARAVAEEFAQ